MGPVSTRCWLTATSGHTAYYLKTIFTSLLLPITRPGTLNRRCIDVSSRTLRPLNTFRFRRSSDKLKPCARPCLVSSFGNVSVENSASRNAGAHRPQVDEGTLLASHHRSARLRPIYRALGPQLFLSRWVRETDRTQRASFADFNGNEASNLTPSHPSITVNGLPAFNLCCS